MRQDTNRVTARPGSYACADLGPEPAAAAQARRLTRDTLARWDMRDLTIDAEIIASELAANAIKAATPTRGTLPAIILAIHHRPGELRIIVWDKGPGHPAHRDAGPDAEAGRGLGIVDSLTGRNWGWWPTPRSGGKVVWAAVPAPQPSPPPSRRNWPRWSATRSGTIAAATARRSAASVTGGLAA